METLLNVPGMVWTHLNMMFVAYMEALLNVPGMVWIHLNMIFVAEKGATQPSYHIATVIHVIYVDDSSLYI